VKLDPNSGKSPRERGSSGNWESPQGDTISPLRFDSSPKEMYKHKENLHVQLQQSFSASKSYHNSCNKSVTSAEKVGGTVHIGAHCQGEVKQVPKARATVVSARRVISTRLTHQVMSQPVLQCFLRGITPYLFVWEALFHFNSNRTLCL
jgi:hypothetical protein